MAFVGIAFFEEPNCDVRRGLIISVLLGWDESYFCHDGCPDSCRAQLLRVTIIFISIVQIYEKYPRIASYLFTKCIDIVNLC